MDTSTFDEEGVRYLLAGDESEIQLAMTSIHNNLQRPLLLWLRRRFPGLSADDLTQAWSSLLIDVLRAAREHRYDGKRALLPWLCTILSRRALDHLRRESVRRKTIIDYRRFLEGTLSGSAWEQFDSIEQNEFIDLVRDHIVELPTQQRLVLQAFADHFPDSLNMALLQEMVSRRTGRSETLASVKRALQEGRRKLRTLLRRRGYMEAKNDDPK